MFVNVRRKEKEELQAIAISPIIIYIGGEALVVAGAVSAWNPPWAIVFDVLGAILFGAGIFLTFIPARNEYERKKELIKKIRRDRINDLKIHLDTLRLSFDTNKTKISKDTSLENQYWSILTQIESDIIEIGAELDKEKEVS